MRTRGSLAVLFAVILSFFLVGPTAKRLTGNALAADFSVESIQNAYGNIKDIKGSFVQKSTIKDLKRTDTFRGTFLIKVPSKMRWQYHGDNKQDTEVIIGGGEMVIYQRSEKQAFRGKFDRESYGQAPIALLGGFGNIRDEFDVSQEGDKIVLKPKRSMGGVLSIEIGPSGKEFPIGSLTIVDKRRNRIEITFKEIALNSGIRDSAFGFSPRQGVSVYEYSKPQ